ncbi:MAG: M20 family metallo-hydrolase [Prevotella sp.]|nr:M20 family metallo-hydrolase [Prevotella sp.]
MTKEYTQSAVELLQGLISIPSVSREENAAADLLQHTIETNGLSPKREGNNLWVESPCNIKGLPTILLNAHIDTVRPVASWTRDPFTPTIEDGRLYGLGSNDCGGGLVSLLQVFLFLSRKPQRYNLIYLASAEEEVSGKNGISSVLPLLPSIDVAIVGEPTGMQPAVAEKGLMVIELTSKGKSGHAARNEGVNAIYKMLDDLIWLRDYRFKRVSDLLGPTLMNVTMVNAGTQHNVVPDQCVAVVDIRTNELYDNEELLRFIQSHVSCETRARSTRLHSSHISLDHPIINKCIGMGMHPFGSPTLSDQALMPFPSLKLGPGESSRSHSADEYIFISEIDEAIDKYIQLLDGFCF